MFFSARVVYQLDVACIAQHRVRAETTETAETQFSQLHVQLVGLHRSVRPFPTCRALGQLLSIPPTITNFNSCGKRIAMSLSSEQKRLVKRYAGPLLPNPTPRWSEIGEDLRKELRERLVRRLRDTRNTETADIIEKYPHLCWANLQEKVKTMRQSQSTFPAPVDSCSKLLFRPALLILDRQTQGFCIASGGPGGSRHSIVTSALVVTVVILRPTDCSLLCQHVFPAGPSGAFGLHLH